MDFISSCPSWVLLARLWREVVWKHYGPLSTGKQLMNGHAYARCVRAYSLTACAIINVMKENFPDVKDSMQFLEKCSSELVRNERNEQDVLEESAVIEALQKVNDCCLLYTSRCV